MEHGGMLRPTRSSQSPVSKRCSEDKIYFTHNPAIDQTCCWQPCYSSLSMSTGLEINRSSPSGLKYPRYIVVSLFIIVSQEPPLIWNSNVLSFCFNCPVKEQGKCSNK